jgi:hypothetical protein
MSVQIIDLETFEAQLASKFERYQQRFKISHADLAWILLRIGTSYYFKDICSREQRYELKSSKK